MEMKKVLYLNSSAPSLFSRVGWTLHIKNSDGSLLFHPALIHHLLITLLLTHNPLLIARSLLFMISASPHFRLIRFVQWLGILGFFYPPCKLYVVLQLFLLEMPYVTLGTQTFFRLWDYNSGQGMTFILLIRYWEIHQQSGKRTKSLVHHRSTIHTYTIYYPTEETWTYTLHRTC